MELPCGLYKSFVLECIVIVIVIAIAIVIVA